MFWRFSVYVFVELYIIFKNMYSPKVKEEFIPILYNLKQKTGKTMTKLINEAVKKYLKEIENLEIKNNDKRKG